MSRKKLQLRVREGVWINVDEINKLPSHDGQRIYMEEAEFRDVLTVNGVAVALGISVRHLRRMIETNEFPASILKKGQTNHWLRQTVRAWKKDQLSTGARHHRTKSEPRRWSEPDDIVNEEERDLARKSTDTQKLVKDVRDMNSAFASDPVKFEKDHPNLSVWLEDAKKRGVW